MSNSSPFSFFQGAMDGLAAAIVTELQTNRSIEVDPSLIDQTKVKAWIDRHNWTNVGDVVRAQGGQSAVDSWNGCDSAKDINTGKATEAANCYRYFYTGVVTWAAKQYAAAPQSTGLKKSVSFDRGVTNPSGEATPGNFPSQDASGGGTPPAAPASNTGTMLAVAAGVLAVGGVGYYLWSKSKEQKENPALPPRRGPWGQEPHHVGETWLDGESDGRRRAKVRFSDGSLRIVDCAGTADTFFSIPARARISGKSITGYVTSDDESGEYVFRPMNTDKDLLASLLGRKRSR